MGQDVYYTFALFSVGEYTSWKKQALCINNSEVVLDFILGTKSDNLAEGRFQIIKMEILVGFCH